MGDKTDVIGKGFLSGNLYDLDVIAWRSRKKKSPFLLISKSGEGSDVFEYTGCISFNEIEYSFMARCDDSALLSREEKEETLERLNTLQRLVNEFVEQSKKDIEYCDEHNTMASL